MARRKVYTVRERQLRVIAVMRQFDPSPVSFRDLQTETGFAGTTLRRTVNGLIDGKRMRLYSPGGLGRGHVAMYRIA